MSVGRIVVGVDGSDGSLAALRWAGDEAQQRGASLHVVHAWLAPYVGDISGMAAIASGQDAFEVAARQVLDQSVEAAGPALTDLPVDRALVHGDAASTLLSAAADAELLVVGARGHGGFIGLLLGSVSSQCTHHAPCPVVIVPPVSGRGAT